MEHRVGSVQRPRHGHAIHDVTFCDLHPLVPAAPPKALTVAHEGSDLVAGLNQHLHTGQAYGSGRTGDCDSHAAQVITDRGTWR